MPASVRPQAPTDQAAGADVVGALGGSVGGLQRARILAAMSELAAERGAADVTVAHVVARSGVSRRTFYEVFEDRESCLRATFEHGVQRASAVASPAFAAARARRQGWEQQLRAALGALLAFFDEEPALARLCIVDGLAGGREVLESRARVIQELVEVVHAGGASHKRRAAPRDGGQADERPRDARPRRIVAEGVVGAVLGILHKRLQDRDGQALSKLLNQLMGIIVLPYLGPAAAARELAHPLPRTRRRGVVASDPLRELDMRLTYRTVRVLLAIAAHPDASSREIADAAGVNDQGQISKLLWRLEHLGLIANGAPRAGSNAWTLTPKGREVQRAIQAQTAV
jgi:AcrR family transcriptional regulator